MDQSDFATIIFGFVFFQAFFLGKFILGFSFLRVGGVEFPPVGEGRGRRLRNVLLDFNLGDLPRVMGLGNFGLGLGIGGVQCVMDQPLGGRMMRWPCCGEKGWWLKRCGFLVKSQVRNRKKSMLNARSAGGRCTG